MQILRQNTEVIVRVGPFVDVADGFTPQTDITLGGNEAELLKNASVEVDISGNTWTAITDCRGWYDLTLSASNTDTCGLMTIVVQDDSDCLPVFTQFQVIEEAIYDALFAASAIGFDANQRVDVGKILGTAVSTPATAGILDINVKNIANAVVNTANAQVGVNIVSQSNIDFGALQKTSLNAATPASIQGDTKQTGDAYAEAVLIHAHAQTIETDVAAIHTHANTIDGHITADYGTIEKAAVNLLDDAVGGLADIHTDIADIHTDVADIHTDIGTAITNIGDVHATDLPALKVIMDNIHDTDLPAVKTDTAAVKAKTDLIPADITTQLDTNVPAIKTKTDLIGASVALEAGGNVAAIKAKTDNLPAAPADDTSIDSQLAAITGYIDTEVAAIKAKTDLIPADITTQLDTNVPAIKAKTDLIGASVALEAGGNVAAIKTVTDKLGTAVELDGAVYRLTQNALEMAPSGGASVGAIADAVWEETAVEHITAGTTGKKLNDISGGAPINVQHDSTHIVRN